ncbi:hypothetical protein Y032_0332g2777 [Ancylostoma ceylanicum]|uniref:Uncharacterized protein n=1 Tax=Ancylostoma ceylanicum TaxID=53326 RepID=A0A016S075_9BILA|nr:hypothetical protein Y032_0332g2777 [Ancylostoma ceylanicum]
MIPVSWGGRPNSVPKLKNERKQKCTVTATRMRPMGRSQPLLTDFASAHGQSRRPPTHLAWFSHWATVLTGPQYQTSPVGLLSPPKRRVD